MVLALGQFTIKTEHYLCR